MRVKVFVCILLSFCMTLLSSCEDRASEYPAESVISEENEITSDTEAVSSEDSEYRTISEDTEISTETETETTESETSEITDVSDTETETAARPAETSVTAASETKTETETTTAKTETEPPQTAAKPKAEAVIPKIKMPEATGEKVISGTNAEVDYSNAAEGYISVLYTGGAAGGKVRIKCGNLQYDHDLSVGKREFFPLMESGSYSVKVYEQFSGAKYAEIADGSFDAAIKSSTGMYLYPNKYVDFNGSSSCVKKAAEVCAGESGDVEKIALIFTYISENITYDKQLAAAVQSGYIPNPDGTLAAGKGICFDYASLFAAMCRSQGIPARLVIGYAEPNIYHAWNEVYTDETGWITPELFLKKKGYNIADATFYAGNSDKKKISEYISDEGNYSAMYRY